MKTNIQSYQPFSFTIEKASNAFLGIRSLGLFAPLSYWRSQDDWGIGDLDVFIKVVEFAKQMHASILSLLPLNIPLFDNCPYANASIFVFNPVYIGLNMLIEYLDMDEETTLRFFARRTEHRKKVEEQQTELEKKIDELDDLMKSDRIMLEGDLKARIDEILQIQAEFHNERVNFISSLNDILTYTQIANLLVFERKFKDEVRRLLFKERKPHRME